MAIIGLITDVGVQKSIDAANDDGFFVKPTEFGVSSVSGALNSNRTSANSNKFYQAPISSRVVVDSNTIKFVCTVPPGSIAPAGVNDSEDIKEIYIFAEDSNNDEFLLAVGQPSEQVIYSNTGSTTLELQITLSNLDVTGNYLFQFTQATEISEHNFDPNAHPELVELLSKASLYLKAGSIPYQYSGQKFLEYPEVEFDGVKAVASRGGVTFTAIYNGDDLNGEILEFDGVSDILTVVTEFNNEHPLNPIEHDGSDSQVLSAGSATFFGGSYNVEEKDLVYLDTDGILKSAIAGSSPIESNVIGAAYRYEKLVRGLNGFVNYNTGFSIGDELFLSSSDPGKIVNTDTGIKVGSQVTSDIILLSTLGGSSGSVTAGYDAVVSDSLGGLIRYDTLQEAILAVPNHGFILVDKIEELKSRVRTFGKTVNVVFRGYNTGLISFLGQNEIQKISFDQVPDSGTWRIEFRELYTNQVHYTNNLPFNASAALIQSEINSLPGHNGCTVTGDYSVGFTVEFNDYINLPLIKTEDEGQNEIQRFEFSAIPTDGTCDFEFEGNSGVNHAFNDTTDQLFQVLFPLPSINDIEIRGSFDQKYYEIEFKGVDGKKNQNPISIINSNLNVGGSGGSGGTPVLINGQSTFSVDALTVKEGRLPASNLKYGSQDVVITVTEEQRGTEIGPSKAIELDSNNCQFIGLGRLINFNTGIDMSGYLGTRIEMHFDNVGLPLDGQGQIIGRNFNFDGSIGIEIDAFDAKPIYETPVGAIDGINASFELEYEPNTDSQLALIRDQLWLRNDWYEIVGKIINITEPGAIPVLGQDLLAWYVPDILDFTPDIIYEPWSYENIDGLQDEFKVVLSSNYNRGSDRLEFYRNGLYMNLGANLGSEVNKYQEFSDNELSLSLHTQSDEIFTAINKDYRVLSRGSIFDVGGTTSLDVPTYTLGNNSLRVWRNGLLMFNSAVGSNEQRYTELDSNTIQLSEAALEDDIFQFEISEFSGTREDVTGINNSNTVILSNSLASGKYMVYRNGLLIHESPSLGNAVDRYEVINNFTIQLGENAQTEDVITVIVVPI